MKKRNLEAHVLLPKRMTKEDLEFLNLSEEEARKRWNQEKDKKERFRLISMHTNKNYYLTCIEALNKKMWILDPSYGKFLGYFSPDEALDNSYRSTHKLFIVDPKEAVLFFQREIQKYKNQYEAAISLTKKIKREVQDYLN